MPAQHRPFANHPCATTHPALINQAQTFLALAIGAGTRTTYITGVNSYISFVDSHGVNPAFPASLHTLCLWITHLASPPRHLGLGTCRVYLAAVVNRHADMGLISPLTDAPPLLDRLFAGIKRATTQLTKPKLPITTAVLQDMRPHVNLRDFRDSLLWAMMWTATAGLLRISEFTTRSGLDPQSDRTLRTQQLTLYDHSGRSLTLPQAGALRSASTTIRYAVIHLDASKTDPLRMGADIIISAPDALQALLNYSARCQSRAPSPSTPLFHFQDGAPANRNWLMKQVNKLLVLIGREPKSYSSHSFRKGGAVSLQERGVEDSIIRRSGRWKSDAFHLYLRHSTLDTLVESNAQL
jgi:hypothetical protein